MQNSEVLLGLHCVLIKGPSYQFFGSIVPCGDAIARNCFETVNGNILAKYTAFIALSFGIYLDQWHRRMKHTTDCFFLKPHTNLDYVVRTECRTYNKYWLFFV